MFIKYFSCPHWLWFDRFGDPAKRSQSSRFYELLLERGLLHEDRMLADLKFETVGTGSTEQRFARTQELMTAGVERIYHGILLDENLSGEPDFLERSNDASSKFGDYHYVPMDVKSAERMSEGMRMQLSFYADLLERVQGIRPRFGYILNGSGARIGCELAESRELYERILEEIGNVLAGHLPAPRLSSGCRQSPWFSECVALAEKTHDITLLYNVKSKNLNELRELDVRTVEDAALMEIESIHRLNPELKLKTLRRVQLQAQALVDQTHQFRRSVELPVVDVEIYFDIESDPLRAVDYLFGFLVRVGGQEHYEYQLAESPTGEENMWREFLKWLECLPDDFVVYHFGTFEKARLNILEERYGGSAALDNFHERLIDLNEIVKDKVTLPLYFYGIKDIGRYIGFERSGAISGGGESVAVYERWLETGDR
ncbi:TM0106 family RecB-like putative nuclease, partial [Patescibacteria group bacterium]|nr:TM0106 family RecB-like putative nuclease [Patescibacteria group bacterium]